MGGARVDVDALTRSTAARSLRVELGAAGALFAAGVRRQATYRLALISGIGTNVFFGIIRTALFIALYRNRTDVGGFDEADALTYVWVLQAIFGTIWTPWMFELPESIRSGDFVAELSRPGDVLLRHFAFDLGRVAFFLMVRSPVPLFGAAIVLDLRLPTTPLGWTTFLVSLMLASCVAAALRFLIGAIAFWSPDFRGIFSLVFIPVWFFSGFLIPTAYFPDVLKTIADFSPLVAMLMAPIAIATGTAVLTPLAIQLAWVLALAAVCRAVMRRAMRQLVVFGG